MPEPKRQTVTLSVPYDDDRYPPEGWNWDQLLGTQGTRLVEVKKPPPQIIVMRVEDDDEDADVEAGDIVLTCPHLGCDSHEFFEVDECERWNPMEQSAPCSGVLHVYQRDSDFSTVGWKCQSCFGDCDLPQAPEFVDTEWS